jgi:hypothetical protein
MLQHLIIGATQSSMVNVTLEEIDLIDYSNQDYIFSEVDALIISENEKLYSDTTLDLRGNQPHTYLSETARNAMEERYNNVLVSHAMLASTDAILAYLVSIGVTDTIYDMRAYELPTAAANDDIITLESRHNTLIFD